MLCVNNLYQAIVNLFSELTRPPTYRTKMCTKEQCQIRPDPACDFAHHKSKLRLDPQERALLMEGRELAPRLENCKFWLQGACLKESMCPFLHPEKSEFALASSDESFPHIRNVISNDKLFAQFQTILMKNDFSQAKEFCEDHPNILSYYKGERQILHAIIRYSKCNLNIVEWLVNNGADVNAVTSDQYKFTPLMTAIFYQEKEKARMLLNAPGVDLKQRSGNGMSIIKLAERRCPELLEEIIAKCEL